MTFDNESYSFNLPGRIIKYYANQTADIQICAERILSNAIDVTQLKIRKPLLNVPVHTPSGGGWAVTMPISEGDTCILFFSQVGYDHWLYQDKDVAGSLDEAPQPWLNRQFSEVDGYALVGLNTLPRAIQNYSLEHSQWRNNDATQVISLNSNLSIDLTSPVAVTINAPSVTVNCQTSEVNASVSTTVTAPSNIINGPLNVTGTVTTPNLQATSGTIGGILVETHDHAGDGGTGSGPSTGGPRNV